MTRTATHSGSRSGAIVGDSIGYVFGRRGGRKLLERFGRRFPKHFGPHHLARAERMFQRWGVWAVFFGRFVALRRILAGPMAGSLRMHYPRFLIANASGGIVWASLVAVVAYKIGEHAEKSFGQVSLVALGAVAVALVAAWVVFKRRRARKARENPPEPQPADDAKPV